MAKDKPPTERQRFHFQFITTPTSDTPGTTLLVHFNNRRYIFGRVAEGMQRACIQRGVGIKKVRSVFLTGQTTWENMGGLTGLILTLADVQADEKDETTGKRPRLNIHGGPKISHAIACARRFVFRTGMPLTIFEDDSRKRHSILEPNYSDENINVWSLPIRRSRTGAQSPVLSNGRSASPNTVNREQELRQNTIANMFDSDWRKDRLVESRFDEVKLPAVIWHRNPESKELLQIRCATMADAPDLSSDSKVFVRNPWPAALVGELPPADNLSTSTSMSYIVKGHTQRGTFLPQKAKELGVPAGPVYARLAAGESITLANGNIVTSEMVLTPPEPGKGMAIFDVPTVAYLEGLASKLEELSSVEVLAGVELATWLLGPEVFYSAKYREIVASLPHTKHYVASLDTCPDYLAFESSSASLLRLSSIRPECFREPVHRNRPISSPKHGMLTQEIGVQPAEPGLIVQVQPKTTVSTEEVPDVIDVQRERNSNNEALAPLIPAPIEREISTPFDDIEIITLGTGSAVPSKYRNVSASLLRIPGLGNYLIDCGENTLGQLRRAFSPDEMEDILIDLRMIWISHLHADHHLGTLSVIHARNEALEKRGISKSDLYLISEPNMADYIIDYSSIQANKNCVLLACRDSVLTLKGVPIMINQTSLPIKTFATTLVSHCHGAQALSITFSNGFKFSYSGDCRPSSNFARIGADSDVLLHEATFDDGMEGDAKAKKHSTTGEALGVATQMRAKQVILTHFSQRYQKLPMLSNIKPVEDVGSEEVNEQDEGPIDPSAQDSAPNTTVDGISTETQSQINAASALSEVAARLHVCVAFDLMRVKVHQIRDMYRYYPAIEKMFEIELARNEAKKEALAAAYKQQQEQKKPKAKGQEKAKKQLEKKADHSSTQPQASLYERVNRGRSSKSNSVIQSKNHSPAPQIQVESSGQTNQSQTQSVTSSTSTPIPSSTFTSTPTIPTPTPAGLSNRAHHALLKNQARQRHKAEKKLNSNNDNNANQTNHTDINDTTNQEEKKKNKDALPLFSPSSPSPEMNEAKRRKIDNGDGGGEGGEKES